MKSMSFLTDLSSILMVGNVKGTRYHACAGTEYHIAFFPAGYLRREMESPNSVEAATVDISVRRSAMWNNSGHSASECTLRYRIQNDERHLA